MVVVKFKRKYGVYNTDEVAGFDDKVGEELIKRGIAEEVKTLKTAPVDKMVKNEDTKQK